MISESVRASYQPERARADAGPPAGVSGTAWRSRTDPALTDLDWRQGDQIGAAITLVSSATIAASIFAIARLVFF